MAQTPDDLVKRIAAMNERNEMARESLLKRRVAEQQIDTSDNIEALKLGRHYAAMLQAAGVKPVKIYDNVPVISETWLLKLGVSYSYADSSIATKSHEEIDRMLQPTGEGWVASYGKDYDGEGSREWIYGLSTKGEPLQSFKQQVQVGSDSPLLNGRGRELMGGIIRPDRLVGGSALRRFSEERYLDGLAWILGGNSPLKVN